MAKKTITLELTQEEFNMLGQALEGEFESVAECDDEKYQKKFITLCEKLGIDYFNQEWIDEHMSRLIEDEQYEEAKKEEYGL